MEKINSKFLEKSFEYCYIQWSITNATFIANPDEYILRSSVFAVNYPQVTKWRLALKSSWTVDAVNMLSVSLERLETDCGPKSVWNNWRISLLKNDNEHFIVECEDYFEANQARELDIIGFPEVSRVFSNSTMTILCQMIVDHNHDAKKFGDFEGVHFSTKSLSDDLRRLCNRSTFYDIVLKIDYQYFRAHRSILSARNTFLCDFIGPDSVIDIGGVDPEALDRVLRYFYTGNLLYIFVNPTIALYKCLEQFRMKELIVFFTKQKFGLLTEMKTRDYTLNWSIELPRDANYLCSEFMRNRRSEEIWQFHLYPKGVEGNSSHMDLFIEYAKGHKPIDILIEIAVLDCFNGRLLQSDLSGYLQVSERFEFRDCIPRNLLPHILRRGVLHLVVTVQKSSGEHHSSIVSHNQEFCPEVIPKKLYYVGLSVNMEQLYNAKSYFDVTLIAGGKPFFAHKCVLAARSKMFLAILKEVPRKVVYLEIESHILQLILKYIYSGNLPCQDIDILKQLYETALIYGIPSLKKSCVSNLKDLITQDTVVDILVFADERQNDKIKYAALDFIWRSQNRQSNQQENWENLHTERPTLFRDIIDYIMMKDLEVSGN